MIIGPAWLKLLEERAADSRDWVRYEIAQSLKRTWLPVVPVCSPGVDIPQPHQLPEELKDLAWRDGITLDPFQDFDSHLNRLLGDLDRVLEAVREEKDQLRRARSELVTGLAWRADQLEQTDLAEKQQLREIRQSLITLLLCRVGQVRTTLRALIARRSKDLYVSERA